MSMLKFHPGSQLKACSVDHRDDALADSKYVSEATISSILSSSQQGYATLQWPSLSRISLPQTTALCMPMV